MNTMSKVILGVFAVLAFVLLYAIASHAQAAQQSVLTWEAYVEPAIVPLATTVPTSLQFNGYQINRGVGSAVCNVIASQLPTFLVTIPKAVLPAITPSSFIDTTYPDQNGIVCWEVYVRFVDGTFSLRSKRLFKEIISSKPIVGNPQVQ